MTDEKRTSDVIPAPVVTDLGCWVCRVLADAVKAGAFDVALYQGMIVGARIALGAPPILCREHAERWVRVGVEEGLATTVREAHRQRSTEHTDRERRSKLDDGPSCSDCGDTGTVDTADGSYTCDCTTAEPTESHPRVDWQQLYTQAVDGLAAISEAVGNTNGGVDITLGIVRELVSRSGRAMAFKEAAFIDLDNGYRCCLYCKAQWSDGDTPRHRGLCVLKPPSPDGDSVPTSALKAEPLTCNMVDDCKAQPTKCYMACDEHDPIAKRPNEAEAVSEKQPGSDKACDCADRGPGGIATPWPARDVVDKLAEAASILLVDKDYDGHGWELIGTALKVAQAWLRESPGEPVKCVPESIATAYVTQRAEAMTARPAMWGGDLAVEAQLMLLLEFESVLRDGKPARVNRIWSSALCRFRKETLACSLSVTHGGERFGSAAKAVFDIARESMRLRGTAAEAELVAMRERRSPERNTAHDLLCSLGSEAVITPENLERLTKTLQDAKVYPHARAAAKAIWDRALPVANDPSMHLVSTALLRALDGALGLSGPSPASHNERPTEKK